MDDFTLLQEYAKSRSEEAFAALVNRHVNLVYSTALRVVRTPDIAQDVAQMVFMKLSRKAGSLKKDISLTGWLYRCTTYVAQTMVRAEARRQQREMRTIEAADLEARGESVWRELEGFLEGGMAQLSDADQDAVLLRFFEGKSLREVGDVLGISDDAAQKRVNRALTRLREYFADRGVAASSAMIPSLLAAHAIQSAPSSMAAHLVSAVLANGSQLTGTAGMLTKLFAMAKAHTGILAGTAGVVTVSSALLLAPAQSATQTKEEAPASNQTTNGFALRGTVRDVGGKPVAGAFVRLATPKNYIRAYAPPNPPTLVSKRSFQVAPGRSEKGLSAITGTNGAFTLFAPASPQEMKIAVLATNDSGYALVTGQEVLANPDIVLQPWARLEGTLRIGRTLGTNQTVHIGIWGSDSTYEWSLVSHGAAVPTDADGKFIFGKVAPGDLWLTHIVQIRSNDWRESGHQLVHLNPGETVQVQLGGKGQPIIGKVEGENPFELEFHGSMWAEAPGARRPANWNKMDFEAKRNFERQWRESPQSRTFKESVRNYEFAVAPDGSFRVDDVLPGKYRMQVRTEARSPVDKKMQQVTMGEISVEIAEIPGGRTDEPFDVGVITAK